MRRIAGEAAAAGGAQLLAVGLPPTVPHKFPVTPTARYRRIAHHFGMIAHEQGICGCHVHVAVPSRPHAIYVSNWLRPWLHVLLALTANSAIYRNTDSGYASFRSVLWSRWPSSGPPPHFDSAAQYDAAVAMLEGAGAALDDGMIYWDVRPSANFPTVEVRVSDVPATVAETVLVATLIRAGVMTALRGHDEGESVPRLADCRSAQPIGRPLTTAWTVTASICWAIRRQCLRGSCSTGSSKRCGPRCCGWATTRWSVTRSPGSRPRATARCGSVGPGGGGTKLPT